MPRPWGVVVYFSMKFYKEARKKSSQVCKDIMDTASRDVAFIGSGDLAEICYLGIKEWGLILVAVFDDTDKKQFMGIDIKPYSELNSPPITNHFIICKYDKSQPMSKTYIPKKLSDILSEYQRDSNNTSILNKKLSSKQIELFSRFHWIF